MAHFVQPVINQNTPSTEVRQTLPLLAALYRNRLVASPARRFSFHSAARLLLSLRSLPHMAYVTRYSARRPPRFSAESLYILVVLAAFVATTVWVGSQIGVNLSAISTVVAVLGINEKVGTTRHVGYSAEDVAAAAYCNPGQAPAFVNGIATLKQSVGEAMGTPVECEHALSAAGDTLQQTTTGLAAYDAVTNTVTFTNGWHHWAITSSGYVTWDGTETLPPARTASGQARE